MKQPPEESDEGNNKKDVAKLVLDDDTNSNLKATTLTKGDSM